jgi:uncharacterized DUF497 family protein
LALQFEWDLRKAAGNQIKHRVSFEDAATLFGDPLGRIVPDPRHSSEEDRFALLGLSKERRLPAVMYVERGEAIRIVSARRRPARSEGIMKKPSKAVAADEILPEYDFSRASRNKYASRYAEGSAVVVLEPDVAATFPTSGEANAALRALAAIIQKHQPRRAASRRG